MPEREKPVTILDIARRANVSPSTVSRVLRDTAVVSDEKHQAVMAAVAELNYRPNIFAQSLASGQSMTIGVLTQRFGSPFYDGILQGILLGLEKTAYTPLFADGRWELPYETQALDMLVDRQIDGLIVIGGNLPEARLRQVADHMPLVVVARQVAGLPDHCLYVDNITAGQQATNYLLNEGHREIAYITGPLPTAQDNDIAQRYAGYRQALDTAGVAFQPELVVTGNLQQESGVTAVETLLARAIPFSAIFAANDQMAYGARLALFRRKIWVPEHISMIGFDDESAATYMIPPLTTMRQPSIELGRASANALLDQMAGRDPTPQVFSAELMVRDSVAAPNLP